MEPAESAVTAELIDADRGSPFASDTEASDMAAMMGFSSFGAKPNPPSKKRKLEQMAASKVGAGSGSGSNTMPLGKPRGKKQDADRGSKASDQQRMGQDGSYIEPSNAGQGEETLREVESDGEMRHGGEVAMSGKDHQAGTPAGGLENQHNWNALRRGVRNERGDVAYYDASFVEDPWKHLKIT